MEYFAGANTGKGFVSLFGEVFGEVERLFIIKGSCGCGKSTLMRRVAAKSRELGYDADLIYCSGDPDSLDGVVIPALSAAVCDGTAPHVVEPKYPCVKESILNLGEFLDYGALSPRREEIIALTAEKSQKYASAYRLLAASNGLRASALSSAVESVDVSGLSAFAERFFKRAGAIPGKPKTIFASAFTGDGIVEKPAFAEAYRVVRVAGPKQVGVIFLGLVASLASDSSAVIALSPLDGTTAESVFFPNNGLLLTSRACPGTENSPLRRVNLSRFVKRGEDPERSRARLAAKLAASVESEAAGFLADASAIHRSLERIYVAGTDFSLVEAYTSSVLKRIFGE